MFYIAVKSDGEVIAGSDSPSYIDEFIASVEPTATRVEIANKFEGAATYLDGVLTIVPQPDPGPTLEEQLAALALRVEALENGI